MALLNLHVPMTVECLNSCYHHPMFGHSRRVDLENDSANPEEDACICLSDSFFKLHDFSDYTCRCTHLFDVQTSEYRFLTLWAKHHLTLETGAIQQICSEARNRAPVLFLSKSESRSSSTQDRETVKIEKNKRELSDFGVVGHPRETKLTEQGSI